MDLIARHRAQPSIAVDLDGVVVVRGPLSDRDAGQLRRSAIDAIDTASAELPVVIDLRACTELGDAALVALICADHHAVRSGRRLVLRGPSLPVLDQIRSLAASLLPLVEELPASPEPVERQLSLVLDLESFEPPACERRRGGLPRWRDPLRRPSRPPMGESA